MAESLSARLGPESYPDDGKDAVLVEGLARGDSTCFDRLVEQYQGRVARLAHRLLGWPQEVDDVVQEVFLAVLRGLPKFRGQSRLDTWLTRITINKCRTHRRRQFLRLRWLNRAQPDRVASPAAPADQATMDVEKLGEVRKVVRALPARYREVVVLRYLEEMPIEAVAQALGLSRNTVEVRLHRARARLKDQLAGLIEE